MREDMFKVIVERPRGGKGWAPHSRKRLTGDGDLPVKIGVRRHMAITHARSKRLNENLKPLKRYLGRQVGRRWDDVYSEIAATLAPGHTVKQHVRQHLDDFVARHVVLAPDGSWHSATRSRWFGTHLPWHEPYYVDPRDGVLRESKALWRKLGLDARRPRHHLGPPHDPNARRLDDRRELRCIAGSWYEVEFRHNRGATGWVYDHLTRANVLASERHAVAKRQLSGAEIKAHGLANTPLN
jgi:hypothetical protein